MNFSNIQTLNNYLIRMIKYLKATHYELAAINFQHELKQHYQTNIRKIQRSLLSDAEKHKLQQKDALYKQNKRSQLDPQTKLNLKEKKHKK